MFLLLRIACLLRLTRACSDASPVQNWGSTSLTQIGQGCSSSSCSSVTQKSAPTINGCDKRNVGADHDFTPACMFHDACYGRCTDPANNDGEGFLKDDCDTIFLIMMNTICANATGTGLKSFNQTSLCLADAYTFQRIEKLSTEAYTAVVNTNCQCSEQSQPISSTWYSSLSADMQARPEIYASLNATITPLLTDPDAFRNYLCTGKTCATGRISKSNNFHGVFIVTALLTVVHASFI